MHWGAVAVSDKSSAELFDRLLSAQLAFASAPSIGALTDVCRQLSLDLGFRHFVYALRVPTNFANARLIILDGYPPEWVQRYFACAYHDHDPVMAYCSNQVVPICWSDLTQSLSGPSRHMMADAAAHGLVDGVTAPVHSPQGELGVFSLASDASPEEARRVAVSALPWVAMLAGHLHEAVRRVSGLLQQPTPDLSPRELECLRWAADGKTSSEIAQLLGMSERTVNFHLQNAVHKLDVANRQHAVVKAAATGLIQPKPF